MTQRSKNNISQVETEIRTKLGAGFTLREIVVGLHNALAFGDVLIDNGYEFSDADFAHLMGSLGELGVLANKFTK